MRISLALRSMNLKTNLTLSAFSPRDTTGGLGVKMVEYVLGGSPTNKESPLNLEPRLRSLKIDDVKVNTVGENFFIKSHFWRFFNSGQR